MSRINTLKRIGAAAFAVGAIAASAQAGITIDWYTIDGGGGTSSAGTLSVSGTLGQHDAGVLTGGGFTVKGGFWAGVETPPACPGDVDGDNDVDSTDLNIVLTDFACAPPNPCTGDADGDGDTDSTDLNIVLSAFGDVCD